MCPSALRADGESRRSARRGSRSGCCRHPRRQPTYGHCPASALSARTPGEPGHRRARRVPSGCRRPARPRPPRWSSTVGRPTPCRADPLVGHCRPRPVAPAYPRLAHRVATRQPARLRRGRVAHTRRRWWPAGCLSRGTTSGCRHRPPAPGRGRAAPRVARPQCRGPSVPQSPLRHTSRPLVVADLGSVRARTDLELRRRHGPSGSPGRSRPRCGRSALATRAWCRRTWRGASRAAEAGLHHPDRTAVGRDRQAGHPAVGAGPRRRQRRRWSRPRRRPERIARCRRPSAGCVPHTARQCPPVPGRAPCAPGRLRRPRPTRALLRVAARAASARVGRRGRAPPTRGPPLRPRLLLARGAAEPGQAASARSRPLADNRTGRS